MSFQNRYKGSIIKIEMIAKHTFQHTFVIGCNSHVFHQIMWDPYKFGGTQVSFNQSKECVKKMYIKMCVTSIPHYAKEMKLFSMKTGKGYCPLFLIWFLQFNCNQHLVFTVFLPIIDIDKIKCTYFPNGKKLYRKNLVLNYIIRIKVGN